MKIVVHRAKICTQERAKRDVGRSENMGGVSNNAKAPLAEIGLTDLPTVKKVRCPTNPPVSDVPGQTDTQL